MSDDEHKVEGATAEGANKGADAKTDVKVEVEAEGGATEDEAQEETVVKEPPHPDSVHALPNWAKGMLAFLVVLLILMVISGGAAAPSQPWLVSASPASRGYFSAGSVSAGIVNCSSALGIGFFSIGMVSFGLVGSIGIFSVGIFSVGFFSIGIFSLGQVAFGMWAWGAYSRWMKQGDGWTSGRKVHMDDFCNIGHIFKNEEEMTDMAATHTSANAGDLGQSSA